ncbi:MAG: hypothetical protein WC686_05295 [Candidatus Shapirobacteria bacterium]|jgi:hypothetical protein
MKKAALKMKETRWIVGMVIFVIAGLAGWWGQGKGAGWVKAQSSRQDSKITLSVMAGSASVGGTINLKAVLTDANGRALANQKVVFGYDRDWDFGENTTTDVNGAAYYNLVLSNNSERTGFVNNTKAKYQINAYFQGSSSYYPVDAAIDFTIGASVTGMAQSGTSFHKTNVAEAIPYLPWADAAGDDGLAVPHGAVYYQMWNGVNYSFLNNRPDIRLPDGRTIKKPIIYGMPFFNSAGDQSPSNLGSYEIPSSISGCPWRTIPKYCDTNWQNAYLAKVAELGTNLDNKVDGVMVSFGYDGEANFVKNYKACEDYLSSTYDCKSATFNSMLKKAIDAHLQAFKNTPVFVQALPEGFAEAQAKDFGYKYNGFTGNSGEWGITFNAEYSTWIKYPKMRRAFESKIGGDGLYRSYWMILNMLNAKPDFIDFFENHYPIFDNLPWFYSFVTNTLGKDTSNTQHVWTVLRDVSQGARKDSSHNPLVGELAGYYGDFNYYLYRKENAPGSKTVPIPFDDVVFNGTYRGKSVNDPAYDQPYTNRFDEGPLPDKNNGYQPIDDPPYTNYMTARKNAPGNQYMSFDVDNGWIYAGQVPNGNLSYEVVVIYLDNGSDSLSLEYKDKDGNLKSRRIQKNNTKRWIRTSDSSSTKIVLNDAYFNDQLEGMTDIRINSNGDGDEIVHMVDIVGNGNGVVPTTGPTTVPPTGAPPTNIPPTNTPPTNTPVPPTAIPTMTNCSQCSGRDTKKNGDANCDGVIGDDDEEIWKNEYNLGNGGVVSRNNWEADFNCDGLVDILDRSIWRFNRFRGAAPTSGPNPTTVNPTVIPTSGPNPTAVPTGSQTGEYVPPQIGGDPRYYNPGQGLHQCHIYYSSLPAGSTGGYRNSFVKGTGYEIYWADWQPKDPTTVSNPMDSISQSELSNLVNKINSEGKSVYLHVKVYNEQGKTNIYPSWTKFKHIVYNTDRDYPNIWDQAYRNQLKQFLTLLQQALESRGVLEKIDFVEVPPGGIWGTTHWYCDRSSDIKNDYFPNLNIFVQAAGCAANDWTCFGQKVNDGFDAIINIAAEAMPKLPIMIIGGGCPKGECNYSGFSGGRLMDTYGMHVMTKGAGLGQNQTDCGHKPEFVNYCGKPKTKCGQEPYGSVTGGNTFPMETSSSYVCAEGYQAGYEKSEKTEAISYYCVYREDLENTKYDAINKSVAQNLGSQIKLVSASLGSNSQSAGASVDITSSWMNQGSAPFMAPVKQGAKWIGSSYRMFVEFVPTAGGGAKHALVGNDLQTQLWKRDLTNPRTANGNVTIPANLAKGVYKVYIGWTDPNGENTRFALVNTEANYDKQYRRFLISSNFEIK